MDGDALTQAEGWRPEPGSVLIGRVVDLASGWSDFSNDHYPIITVQPDDGDAVAIHCFHTALRRRVEDLAPVPGERIGIKYEGKRPTKDGKREVATYIVRVEGRSQTDFWDRQRGTPSPASDVPAEFKGEQQAIPEGDDDIPF